jgi:hypothetical protein
MSDRSRRTLGAVLIGASIVVLVAVGGWWAGNQARSASLRAQLSLTPAPTQALPPSVTPVPPETLAPTETLLPPTVVVETPASETETPSPEPTATLSQPTPTETTAVVASPTASASPPPTVAPTPTVQSELGSAPVRIVIPDLKIDAPVTEMGWRVVDTASGPRSDWVIPKNGAGHHINSALLGESSNLVISGHNNIFGQVFKPISFAWDNDSRTPVDSSTDRSDVLTGRSLQLFDATGHQFDYVIRDFYRLKDTGVSAQQRIANGRFMEPTDQAQVTIITCWPPTSNTHRLVVVAVPATN